MHKYSNPNFVGLVLSVDANLFTLSSQVIEQVASKTTLKKIRPVAEFSVINRIIHACKIGAQDDLIADFKVNRDGVFYLLAANLKVYFGNVSSLGVFESDTAPYFDQFSIDEHGSFIHWEHGDIHLDLTP